MNMPGFNSEASLYKASGYYQTQGHFGQANEVIHPAFCSCGTTLAMCEDNVGYIGCICVPGNGRFYHYLLPVASC